MPMPCALEALTVINPLFRLSLSKGETITKVSQSPNKNQTKHHKANNTQKQTGHPQGVKHYAFRNFPCLSVLLRKEIANISHRCPTGPKVVISYMTMIQVVLSHTRGWRFHSVQLRDDVAKPRINVPHTSQYSFAKK